MSKTLKQQLKAGTVVLTIPVEDHGKHPETDANMLTGYNLTFPKGTDIRKARREFRRFCLAFGVKDWRRVSKDMDLGLV